MTSTSALQPLSYVQLKSKLQTLHKDLIDVVERTERNSRYWSSRGKSRRKTQRLQWAADSNNDDGIDISSSGSRSGGGNLKSKFTSWEFIRSLSEMPVWIRF